MAKPFMNCNFKNCGAALTRFGWITRCSHVFCDEHGEMFFRNGGTQVRCPVCNEIKNRETDVIRNDLNPSDLLIAAIRPQKALEFALHAVRLWTHQMEYRRKCQTDEVVRRYESLAAESMVQLQSENREMKKYIQTIERKLKYVNDELFKMRTRLNKYKGRATKIGYSMGESMKFVLHYIYVLRVAFNTVEGIAQFMGTFPSIVKILQNENCPPLKCHSV